MSPTCAAHLRRAPPRGPATPPPPRFSCQGGAATPSPPEVIARTFKLTPTELRVLLAVVEVGGVPEAAEALGIGQATVKTHLHRLFCKTATPRQAELVKLVAAFSNPLVG